MAAMKATFVLGEGVMPRQLPIVMCPGCNKPMMPSDDLSPLLSTDGLQEVTYTCHSCSATTVRTMKVDEE
jgi:RNase P subunit RPR2